MSILVSTPMAGQLWNSFTAQAAILNSQGEIIAVNDFWKQLARENGCTDENYFIGANYLSVCEKALKIEYDRTTEEVYLGLQAILRGEQNEFSIEIPHHSPMGTGWFLMRAISFAHEKEFYIFVLHEDITRIKKSLGEAQNRFQNFIQSLPDAIYTLDLTEHRATSFNRNSFLGYSYDELTGAESIQQSIHPEDAALVTTFWQRMLQGDTPKNIEYRMRNKTGQWEWVDSRETVISSNPDGTPKEIMVILRVITDRKLAEEQIAFHARILENVNDVIIGTDEDFLISYWNTAAERTFGWKSEEVIGKSTLEVLRTVYSEGGREDSINAIRETGAWKGEVIQYTKDNQPVNIDANIMTIRNGAGRINGFVSANRDITKRKQMEEKLLQAKEAIEAANHELQQTLTREQTLARTDSLTGIFNRRHFFSLAEHEFSVAQRYQMPLSIILFDIDRFKRVNDRWGHQIGDDILKNVSRISREQVRASDILARYGGDELIILLPNTGAEDASHTAERIRATVMSYRIDVIRTQARTTVSMGVAEKTGKVESLDHLIRYADQALYAAKAAGRNCVKVYSEGNTDA